MSLHPNPEILDFEMPAKYRTGQEKRIPVGATLILVEDKLTDQWVKCIEEFIKAEWHKGKIIDLTRDED